MKVYRLVFLLRSVWKETVGIESCIGTYAGSPNKVLNELNLLPDHHGATIEVDHPDGGIYLVTTGRESLLKQEQLIVFYRKRINLNLKHDFENRHKVLLNIFLEKDMPKYYGYSKSYIQL